jgi:hypothetical protein
MSGSWQTVTAASGPANAGTMLLLTDGSVLCHDEPNTSGPPAISGSNRWYKLTPDATGNYRTGTWSALANGPNSPLYFACSVLRDGRVFIAGGEYNGGAAQVELLAAEIYDPVANSWTTIGTHKVWKELKWEIKEHKELFKEHKERIFDNVKLVFEDLTKINEGDRGERFGDQGWGEVIKQLVKRSDELEGELRAFINKGLRPDVGFKPAPASSAPAATEAPAARPPRTGKHPRSDGGEETEPAKRRAGKKDASEE